MLWRVVCTIVWGGNNALFLQIMARFETSSFLILILGSKGIFCVLNEQWQLVSRRAPQGQWPKLRAVWCVLYIYLDVRNLCDTSWRRIYFSKRFTPFCLDMLGNWKKNEKLSDLKTKNDCCTGGNSGEWICISDFSLSFFNLPQEITKEP